MPEVRRIARAVFADHRSRTDDWESTVRALFDLAAHREEWYAALMLLSQRRYATYLDGERDAAAPTPDHCWCLVGRRRRRLAPGG